VLLIDLSKYRKLIPFRLINYFDWGIAGFESLSHRVIVLQPANGIFRNGG
jgi:hypothetical protein